MTQSRGIRVRRGTRQRWVDEQQGKHVCACGCGGAIPLQVKHFNVGIPKYLLGHNASVAPTTPRVKREAKACECGCGALATPGRRYILGHSGRGKPRSPETRAKISEAHAGRTLPRGPAARHWKGGRTKNVHGYIEVQAPDHPLAVRNGYVREHRLVAERHLRAADPSSVFLLDGYLHPGADVHHVNGIKDDNRIENLEVMWRGQHTRHHLPGLIAARWPKETQ